MRLLAHWPTAVLTPKRTPLDDETVGHALRFPAPDQPGRAGNAPMIDLLDRLKPALAERWAAPAANVYLAHDRSRWEDRR